MSPPSPAPTAEVRRPGPDGSDTGPGLGPAPLAHQPARPWRATLSLLGPLLAMLVLLLALAGALALGARWLLTTDDGARWLLQRLSFVQVQGWQGAVLGSGWSAGRLRISWDNDRQWVLIEDVRADGVALRWRPHASAWIGIQARDLQARRVTLQTGPSDPEPTVPPASLAWPVAVEVGQVSVDEWVIDDLSPWRSLKARDVVLDPRPGQAHRIGDLQGLAFGLQLQASGQIGTAAPLPVELQATARPDEPGDAPPWALAATARGPLPLLQVRGTLRGRPVASPGAGGAPDPAPALDLTTTLQPLQSWPLADFVATTTGLDLAALWPAAPRTRLQGELTLQARAKDQPLSLRVELDNLRPGRWSDGALPLRRLTGRGQGQLDQPDRLAFSEVDLQLADGQGSAGRLTGEGRWQGHQLDLKVTAQAVQPHRLDHRAAAMTLSGPLSGQLDGLPSPSGGGRPPPWAVTWAMALEGRSDAAPLPVQLALQGSASADELQLREVRARSGAASAELGATLRRAPRGQWQLTTQGQLQDFDPLPWWPGEPGSAWRRGPHRLSATWDLDARAPGQWPRDGVLGWLQQMAGNGRLQVPSGVLAGVPWQAELQLAYGTPGAAAPGRVSGWLQAAGNRLEWQGQGDPAGTGQHDEWTLKLQGERLAALAPWARLHPQAEAWVPQQGTASATLRAWGRWPSLHTEGQARLSQVQGGGWALASGSAQWQLDTGGQRPLSMQLELAGLSRPGDAATAGRSRPTSRADHLRATLQGTLGEHKLEVSAAMPAGPPPALMRLLDIPADSGTRALLQAQGRWEPETPGGGLAQGGTWRGRVDRLLVGAWDGSPATAPPAMGWASAQDLRASLVLGPQARLLAAQADAGRLQLGPSLALRWDTARADFRPEPAHFQLRADIEAFALAPLLARAQPGLGLQGDLTVAARLDIEAAERLQARLLLERRGGDLVLLNGDERLPVGLEELRLELSAHEGLWQFTPRVRGQMLGDISGSLRTVTTPQARWPHDDAPLEGQIEARVADLGLWSAVFPPGWRLAGQLQTSAAIEGRFGQPRYLGRLSGSGIAVRNLLQGVNVSDGQIALRLDGDTAQIERFTLRGGDGRITVTGEASLGAAPQARLALQAERFRVLGRADRLVVASGQATLRLQRELSRLEGRLRLDQGLIDASAADAPSLDDDVTVRSETAPDDPRTADTAARQRRPFQMAVDIDLGDQLRVRGRGLDTQLRGALRLSTPGGRLAVDGTIQTEGGTYAAYGQRLEIERGLLSFTGEPDNPRLDVLALRPNLDARVGVAITGSLLTPRARLYADPDMSDTDKLSWLVLGRAPDGLGRADTALLQRAAVALLAGEGEAPTDALMRSLGIDELSLRQSEGDVRETVISLGKQLSRRWYVGYERGVNATTGTWQLVYRIAQRFTLRAQSGLENSLDVIWVWRLQETPADAPMRKSTVIPP